MNAVGVAAWGESATIVSEPAVIRISFSCLLITHAGLFDTTSSRAACLLTATPQRNPQRAY